MILEYGRGVKLTLPVNPPVEPMLAKLASAIPEGAEFLYEPKWDGFRALVFKDRDQLYIQSRDLKPFNRYFPDLEEPLKSKLPERCVLDGEIVIATDDRLDFDALQLRLHPAASRVAMLAEEKPAAYVAWDLLAIGDEDLRASPQTERRARLEKELAGVTPPVHVTPATRDRALAEDWFRRFEGAGLDGVMAKPMSLGYLPGKRAMWKIKHARTADVVLAGLRWFKGAKEELVGSLLLGLYDDEDILHHVGVTATFTREMRAQLTKDLAPLRENARDTHPWKNWADWGGDPGEASAADGEGGHAHQRRPGAVSRWSRGKDLSWVPLRLERVLEVGYDHMQGPRFRHPPKFKRWRPDKEPKDCRYDQLEVTPAYEIAKIFGRG
jgi:ATP-dependent DNA ligase